MHRTTATLGALAVLAVLLTPLGVSAYGAAHVGYTQVGPNGVSHSGATVAAGPGGVYAGGHTTAVGYGGASASTYHAGAVGPSGAVAASGTRVYAPSYAAGGYGYVR